MENLPQLLRERATATPTRIFIRSKTESLSYSEIEKVSNQVARALVGEGLKASSRVAILSRNSVAQVGIWWGALKCGAVLVPINFRLALAEMVYILNDAGAEVLFVGKDHYDAAVEMLPQLRCIRKLVAIDGGLAGCESLQEWAGRREDSDIACSIASTDIALQIYTSGTTGRPKGAQLSHANLLANQARTAGKGLWSQGDIALLCMPLCHLGGCGGILRALYFGMQIVLMDKFDPAEVLVTIQQHRVTKAFFVPSMLQSLLEVPGCAQADLSCLDLIHYGAGVMPFELLLRAMRMFKCRYATGYGLTESGGAVTFLSPEDHVGPGARERIKSCGRPSGAAVKVVDEAGNAVAAGTVGEIICSSPQIMSGYFGLPEDTAQTIRDGWLYTGDAGYFDSDGYLHISDRIKDMINSGGLNIYPREVEEALLRHPAILEVAVFGVPDERWQEAVKAVVVIRDGFSLTEVEVISFARESIAKYKAPHSVEFRPSLPRNNTGKVMKRDLRMPYWAGRERLV